MNTEVIRVAGHFEYPTANKPETHWHLNFAHSDVFAFYGGGLLA